MKIKFIDRLLREIDFSDVLDNEELDSPKFIALQNLELNSSTIDKWIGMGEDTAVISGDTQDEIEEKTHEIISEFERKSLCVTYSIDGSIFGYNFNNAKEYAQSQYENVTKWGGKSELNTERKVLQSWLPPTYIVGDEDDTIGEPLVYFFHDKNDLEELLKTSKVPEIIKEEFLFNKKSTDFGIEAFGEIVQMPLSVASKYFDIETE